MAVGYATWCSEEQPWPPGADSGRAWMVAAACSWFSFFTWLPVVCSAVLYVAYMNQNPDVPRWEASWPFTIMLVVINAGGVVYAVASEWLTERSLLFVAAALCAGSLAISSFVHNIVTLVLFLGIVYVSDSGISKTGFLQKLRSVSSVYTWTVCVSKGASNFSSYTFALVAVDYAHDVGVLGQKAALLPALFSSGCLVATLVTGPAVDRNLVSR
ncbi:hypothetical protein IscW_ISCW014383 [Ixodes scapularis]|uniref:Uncharacterized protein n=1 Tax=Ixodes scapularis TaxID=6945 RepID=B7QJF4_IXOSC|nr:hypothetical protein IscW_ISCW014383 [Ixodes scapularis]|eukprot:XP_002415311.1 hypothetical protein IscW_ISCW014383 [Ixodes scapularis]